MLLDELKEDIKVCTTMHWCDKWFFCHRCLQVPIEMLDNCKAYKMLNCGSLRKCFGRNLYWYYHNHVLKGPLKTLNFLNYTYFSFLKRYWHSTKYSLYVADCVNKLRGRLTFSSYWLYHICLATLWYYFATGHFSSAMHCGADIEIFFGTNWEYCFRGETKIKPSQEIVLLMWHECVVICVHTLLVSTIPHTQSYEIV